MNVEKLKRMNELSKELKKHGMAESTKEAFARAGEMVRDEAVGDVITKSKEQPKEGNSFDNQYQIILERQNRQIAQEIQSLKETIAAVQAEIEMLKAEKRSAPAQQKKPKQEEQAKLPQKEKRKEHPKQGEFNSEDVSIEKMFYFGNK